MDVRGCFANQGQRPGPKSFSQKIERLRPFSEKPPNLIEVADDDEDRLVVFPSLELFDCLECGTIERISAEPIESVGAKGDDATPRDDLGCSRSSLLVIQENQL